jgi:hypothetical protein
MAKIFLSHSSKDQGVADRMETVLTAAGHEVIDMAAFRNAVEGACKSSHRGADLLSARAA